MPTVWQLYHDNGSAWQAALEMCEVARKSIDIEQYIIKDAGIGRKMLDLLSQRARHGVEVRIVADAFGSFGLPLTEGGRRLRAAGGRIAMFNGARPICSAPAAAIHRMHRKTFIIDGSELMVGGSCLDPRMADWRDTMARIAGPIVAEAGAEFEASWERAGHAAPGGASDAAGLQAGAWRYRVTTPGFTTGRDYLRELSHHIEHARQSIVLTTPFLCSRRALLAALRNGARRSSLSRRCCPTTAAGPQ